MGLHDPNQARMVAWLDRLNVDVVVFVGDVFHHWWGFAGVIPVDYAPICAAMIRLRKRGIGIHYVRGNHDFHLGPFFTKILGAEVTGPVTRVYDGVRLVVAHGDEADDSIGYRVLRAIIRSGPFSILMAMLGPRLGLGLLRRLAGHRDVHDKVCEALLIKQRAWACDHIKAGASVVIMGHAHAPGVVAQEGGHVVHLGDWSEAGTFALLSEGCVSLRRFSPDKALGNEFSSVSL